MELFNVVGIAIAVIVLYLVTCIRILYEYERAVIFRLGRVLPGTKGPGFIMVFWPVDRLERVSLRIIVQDVPAQDVITRDNVSVKVNAVVYFRVVEPMKAILEVEDYRYATFQLSQTTLRSIIGQVELDDLLAERERVNKRIQTVIDQQTDPWGIKVRLVEVKHVDLPEHMQRVMAKQAESERERRAKVIHAEGEFGAAERLRDAALVIEKHPMAMQMRFLQALTEVGSEQNSTIVFPLPIELVRPLMSVLPADGGMDGSDGDRGDGGERGDGGDRGAGGGSGERDKSGHGSETGTGGESRNEGPGNPDR